MHNGTIPRVGTGKQALSIHEELAGLNVNAVMEDTGAIGRRYARNDEIGTPFCVAVDQVWGGAPGRFPCRRVFHGAGLAEVHLIEAYEFHFLDDHIQVLSPDFWLA
jgi:hypothetical protein